MMHSSPQPSLNKTSQGSSINLHFGNTLEPESCKEWRLLNGFFQLHSAFNKLKLMTLFGSKVFYWPDWCTIHKKALALVLSRSRIGDVKWFTGQSTSCFILGVGNYQHYKIERGYVHRTGKEMAD